MSPNRCVEFSFEMGFYIERDGEEETWESETVFGGGTFKIMVVELRKPPYLYMRLICYRHKKSTIDSKSFSSQNEIILENLKRLTYGRFIRSTVDIPRYPGLYLFLFLILFYVSLFSLSCLP